MPKVRASMKDVSTEYVLIEPGPYHLRIKEIKEEIRKEKAPKSGLDVERQFFVVQSRVVHNLETGSDEHANKPVYHNISVHTKEGEVNEVAVAEMKRYFEACRPDLAEDEDADTNELIGCEFDAEVIITDYESNKDHKMHQKNELNTRSVAPAG